MLSAALCRLLTSCPVIEPPPACEYLCSSTFLPQYHPLCSKTLSSYNCRLPNYKGMNKLWDRCSSIRVTAPCYQKSVCYCTFVTEPFASNTSFCSGHHHYKMSTEKRRHQRNIFLSCGSQVLFSFPRSNSCVHLDMNLCVLDRTPEEL
jgi:hypothetical protein